MRWRDVAEIVVGSCVLAFPVSVTEDDLGIDLELPVELLVGKHRVYGVGPELTIPIATKKMLIGFLNARYLWETGARSTLEGNTFVFTATFPIPSVPLQ